MRPDDHRFDDHRSDDDRFDDQRSDAQQADIAVVAERRDLAPARTSLLPPLPGRHHWCVIVPPSRMARFDEAGGEADLHAELVQRLWEHGLGCARFDLESPELHLVDERVVVVHPAAHGRRIRRAGEILERLARMDPEAEVTLLATGDAIPVAQRLAALAPQRSAAAVPGVPADPAGPGPWPVVRSMLLLPAERVQRRPERAAEEIAALVAADERTDDRRRPSGLALVTRRLLRRLAH